MTSSVTAIDPAEVPQEARRQRGEYEKRTYVPLLRCTPSSNSGATYNAAHAMCSKPKGQNRVNIRWLFFSLFPFSRSLPFSLDSLGESPCREDSNLFEDLSRGIGEFGYLEWFAVILLYFRRVSGKRIQYSVAREGIRCQRPRRTRSSALAGRCRPRRRRYPKQVSPARCIARCRKADGSIGPYES